MQLVVLPYHGQTIFCCFMLYGYHLVRLEILSIVSGSGMSLLRLGSLPSRRTCQRWTIFLEFWKVISKYVTFQELDRGLASSDWSVVEN